MAPNAFNLSILLLMRKAYEKDVSIQDRIKQFRMYEKACLKQVNLNNYLIFFFLQAITRTKLR